MTARAATPQNALVDWEKSVIGTVLADAATMPETQDLLPSDFTGQNQVVWAEIINMYAARGAIDIRAIINTLRNSPDWIRSSGGASVEQYFAELEHYRGTTIDYYVEMVMDAAIKRAVRRAASLIAAEANGNERTAAELMQFAEEKILGLRRRHEGSDLDMADLIGLFIPRLQGMRAGTIQPAWVPELTALRDIIRYAEASEFMIVAGRPGEGKSSYLRFEAWWAAHKGKFVHILNYENDPFEYARYFISMETGLDSDLLKQPTLLTPHQLDQVLEATETLARLPLRISTTPRNANAAIAAARRTLSEKNTQLLMLDYIQLLHNGNDNRAYDVGLSSAALRAFALDYGVPTMAAAQLSREIERRNADEEPKLSDLRESGTIEQDSTIVIFPRPVRSPGPAQLNLFPENLDPHGRLLARPKAIPTYFYVLKNRNGATGKSDPVKWCKHLDKYYTLTPSMEMR